MAYTNCPQCGKRLVVPDNARALKLRCPACKHTFQADGNAGPVEKSPSLAAAAAPVPAAATAGGNGNGAGANEPSQDNEPFNFALESGPKILSAADEAMLRDLGSGSGLLELTREALELQAGERSRGALAADPEPAPGDITDRQSQIVGTALTMANRLVMVYKGELARARRLAMISWIAVASMAVLFGVASWWGMSKSASADLEKANTAGARSELANLSVLSNAASASAKEQIAKLTADLDAARADEKKLQADLLKSQQDLVKANQDLVKATEDSSKVREALSKSESAVKNTAGSLQAANQRVTDLESQISLLKSAATRP